MKWMMRCVRVGVAAATAFCAGGCHGGNDQEAISLCERFHELATVIEEAEGGEQEERAVKEFLAWARPVPATSPWAIVYSVQLLDTASGETLEDSPDAWDKACREGILRATLRLELLDHPEGGKRVQRSRMPAGPLKKDGYSWQVKAVKNVLLLRDM